METFCKLFVNSNQDRKVLLNQLLSLTNGEHSGIRTFENSILIGDIIINKEFDSLKTTDELDGFLYYKYYIDLDSKIGFTDEYVESIRNILRSFKNNNIPAIPACDFEDLLLM